MIQLTAPVDGALSAGAAAILDSDVWFPLVVVLMFLAFAIGHLTGRGHGYIRGIEAERHRTGTSPVTRQQIRAKPQGFADARTPSPSDEDFAEWSRRFDDALRATRGQYGALASPDPRPPLKVMHLGSEKRAVCGQPASTNLGDVRCLARPGHPGQC